MKVADFNFDLPESLIAQAPLAERGASRLLCLDRRSGRHCERRFDDLLSLLRPGDCLVFNDTAVIKARLLLTKAIGGRVEVFVIRVRSAMTADAWLRSSKPVKVGAEFRLGPINLEVTGMAEDHGQARIYHLQFSSPVMQVLEAYGHVPLPPYIRRHDHAEDTERYQTVFATTPGAVAAPTAGLHFGEHALQRLRTGGIHTEFVTLHIGAGTFQPVRVETVESHTLHPEYASIAGSVCERILSRKCLGGRVVAVGTTCVRTLESAAAGGELAAFSGDTNLYIFPGFQFRVVDAVVTNFHLPRSSLLMLVCAFGGTKNVLAAYRHAVDAGYRFYSYGDAMLVADITNAF